METQDILEKVAQGDTEGVASLVQNTLDAGTPAEEILQQGLIEAMVIVGEQFENGEAFVPEMLIAARAMKAGLAVLRPHLVDQETSSSGTVAIGTVRGDLHDIGKNLVGTMLEGVGFRIVDLGVDVSADGFISAVKDDRVDLVAMSALLTTTMTSMGKVIAELKEAGLRDRVKVIVGGAPVSESFATEIGADGYAANASSAARLAKALLDVS